MIKRQKGFLFTKILAILGTILVGLPIVAPFFFGFMSLILSHQFRFDYLMPAEFFPLVLIGAILLIITAILRREQKKLIIWSFVVAIASLIIGQIIAMVTGLATGDIEPIGWQWALVIFSLLVYTGAVFFLGIGGILLIKHFFSLKNTHKKG